MADPQLQKAAEAQGQQQQQQAAKPTQDVNDLLKQFGGFSAVKGAIPAAEDMNPTKKAIKDAFLKDNRKAAKRRPSPLSLRHGSTSSTRIRPQPPTWWRAAKLRKRNT